MIELFLLCCGFVLLLEWLWPVGKLTETGNMWVFILFLALSLLLSYGKLAIYIKIPILIGYALFMLNFLYLDYSFFEFQWIPFLIDDIVYNVDAMFAREYETFTAPFRSLLFFVLLYLMSYLLRYWLFNRRRIFLFLFFTLFYVAFLDTFSPYDGSAAIVRTMAVGLCLMGALTFFRILDKEHMAANRKIALKWHVPIVLIVSGSIIIALFTPKFSPVWPDPVPFLQSFGSQTSSGQSGSRTVGYDEDDSLLGGPFQANDQLVYEVEAEKRQYWKVEHKDFYTGKGWELSVDESKLVYFDREVPSAEVFSNRAEEGKMGFVRSYADASHLIYPSGIHSFYADEAIHFALDPELEKFFSIQATNFVKLDQYMIRYYPPKYSIKQLMESPGETELSGEFLARYTQLPEELPERVKNLAHEISGSEESWYRKAKAIESYLKGPEFTYEQEDVPIPGDGVDYVDQFLFETRRGYCDNFSTSMVVLLRAAGIPARWAKGYSGGDFKGYDESGMEKYAITNNHAHSWVEVFFSGVGWVPFEPTKGYSNHAEFENDYLFSGGEENENGETEEIEEAEQTEEKEEETPDSPVSEEEGEQVEPRSKIYSNLIAAFICLLIVLFVVLYKKRLAWQQKYFVWKFMKEEDDGFFPAAYLVLLKQLEKKGLKRKQGQTLREYAQFIDEYFSTTDMVDLTISYEKYVYKGELEKGVWARKKELWENLIKNTAS